MTALIQQHLARAQHRMKVSTDKSRSERSFEVNDWVYLKLQPYIQSSLAPRVNQKLAFRFFGPFKIIQRIGVVAYKLELPRSSQIHPVFHVSQLKRAVPTNTVIASLPSALNGLQVPEAILQRRVITTSSGVRPQVLIKWSNSPVALSTWEDFEAIPPLLGGKQDVNTGGMSALAWRPVMIWKAFNSRMMGHEEAQGPGIRTPAPWAQNGRREQAASIAYKAESGIEEGDRNITIVILILPLSASATLLTL